MGNRIEKLFDLGRDCVLKGSWKSIRLKQPSNTIDTAALSSEGQGGHSSAHS